MSRDLSDYAVTADGNTVIGMDFLGNLRRYTLPGEQHIANNVIHYEAGIQADTICWKENADILNWDSPSIIYMQQTGSQAQVIAQGKVSLFAYSPHKHTAYFTRDNALYKHSALSQSALIAEDFYEISGLWDTGELYISSMNVSSYRRIFYHDGEKTTELLANALDYDFAQAQPVGIIRTSKMAKDVWYFVSGGQLQLLEDPQIQEAVISPYGNMLAYTTDDGNGNTALHTATIQDGQLGQPVKLDAAVSLETVTFTENGSLRYFKERKQDIGILCIDGEQVDTDVLLYRYILKPSEGWAYPPISQTVLSYCADAGVTVYHTKSDTTLLKLYNGETSVVIDENVADFQITPSGDVFYLRDYDFDRYTGQLWVYRDGERHLVDKNVTALIALEDN